MSTVPDESLLAKLEHGSNSTYTNKLCRCERCKQAHREYMREWMRENRKKQRQLREQERQAAELEAGGESR